MENLYQKYVDCGYRVCTDTRKDVQGSLFFCLKGDNFDGNKFAQKALEMGAKFVVIDNPEYQTNQTILVQNSLETLQKLANYHRKKIKIPIIALTGSNGKTTSKELIYSVLKTSFRAVCTQGNLNNHIGVPLTILSMYPETQIGIVEMGANHLGEIQELCQIADPDFGYITNFGKAHLEGFFSLEGVIKTKCELYQHIIQKQGIIFWNAENEIQAEKLKNYDKTYAFSQKKNTDFVFFEVVEKFPFLQILFNSKVLKTNLVGVYNADNIGVAIAIGRYFGLSDEAIQKGIESYKPTNNRSQIIENQQNKILLDAYNANPASMKVAIENFAEIPAEKKIIILGDMRELGEQSKQEHAQFVELLQKYPWEKVFLIGENFSQITTDFETFLSVEEFLNQVNLSDFNDVFFLIKGSRAMALEKIVPFVK